MDVGSGSTKIKVALVDFCENQIVQILGEDQAAIAFKENLTPEGTLPRLFLDEAGNRIAILAQLAIRNNVPAEDIVIVGTQASREAKNIDDLTKILKASNLNFRVITQQEEAEIGHQSAAVTSRLAPADFTSFDIGGGSFQLVNDSGAIKMIGGHLASVSFKNHVLTKIQSRNQSQTPNPIKPKHAAQAIKYAEDYAKKLRQSNAKFELRKTVIGIGGVFGNSIRNQLGLQNSDTLKTEMIEKEIPKFSQRTADELKGPYADTETTNLLLVLGLMKGMRIKEIKIYKANLTDGILVNKSFYRRLVN